MTDKNIEICLLPKLKGMGGPVSFSRWMIKGLQERGIKVSHDPQSPACKVILLNGGMSRMDKLWLAKRRGSENSAAFEWNELAAQKRK